MEPFSTPTASFLLTHFLLEDEGWGTVTGEFECGDGSIEVIETCDDSNTMDGDGCSAACQTEDCYSCAGEPSVCNPEAASTPCDDDGNQCTDDECDGAGTCDHTNNTDPCDDGISCTSGETCSGGECAVVWTDPDCALDHFKLYKAKTAKGATKFALQQVTTADDFESKNTDVRKPFYLGNPVDKNSEGINVDEAHLECYQIKDTKELPKQAKFTKRQVEITNQFGMETLEVLKPSELCVPSAKGVGMTPDALPDGAEVDHVKCYKVRNAPGNTPFAGTTVTLDDQFESKQTDVSKTSRLCIPVDKNSEGIFDSTENLVCYKIKDTKQVPKQAKFAKTDVTTVNQFGTEELTAIKPQLLCVPSSRLDL